MSMDDLNADIDKKAKKYLQINNNILQLNYLIGNNMEQMDENSICKYENPKAVQ